LFYQIIDREEDIYLKKLKFVYKISGNLKNLQNI